MVNKDPKSKKPPKQLNWVVHSSLNSESTYLKLIGIKITIAYHIKMNYCPQTD